MSTKTFTTDNGTQVKANFNEVELISSCTPTDDSTFIITLSDGTNVSLSSIDGSLIFKTSDNKSFCFELINEEEYPIPFYEEVIEHIKGSEYAEGSAIVIFNNFMYVTENGEPHTAIGMFEDFLGIFSQGICRIYRFSDGNK